MNNQTVCKVFEIFFWINVFSFSKIVEIFFIKFFKNWILCFNCFFRTKDSTFDLILNFHLENLLYLNLNFTGNDCDLLSEAARLIKKKTSNAEWFCSLFEIIFVNSLASECLICEKSSEMNSDFNVKKSSLWKSWFGFFDFAHSSTFVKLIFINLWFKDFLCFLIKSFEELENENWFSYECVEKVEVEIAIFFYEISFANAFFFFFLAWFLNSMWSEFDFFIFFQYAIISFQYSKSFDRFISFWNRALAFIVIIFEKFRILCFFFRFNFFFCFMKFYFFCFQISIHFFII